MRLGNPAVRKLAGYERTEDAPVATYGGITLKSVYFAALTLLAAVISFAVTTKMLEGTASMDWLLVFAIACPVAALVFGLIASFAQRTIPVTGTLYVIFEGLAVGFISCMFDAAYSGVIFSALLATCCTFAAMTGLYSVGAIRVGKKFNQFMLYLLAGALLTQLVIFLMSLFSPTLSAMFYGNGPLAIVISCVMCLVATLMILADLNTTTQIVRNGLDKRYEWRASFGLVTTLIWLYIEFLRLFAILASRRN